MIKGLHVFSICFLLFFSGYALGDSIRIAEPDTISKDSVAVIGQPVPIVTLNEREPVYNLRPAVDIPILAVSCGFSVYSLTKIYIKGASTEEQINNLEIGNINAFDRWIVTPYLGPLDKWSYYPFYASIPLPFVAMLMTKDTRRDYWKLSFLYWEALAITGMFGTGAPYLIDRYRPYAYTPETPMEQRMIQNAKNSAFSGHVEIMAVSTFFIAKVYSDYFPEKKLLMYSMASVATAGMAYIRLKGGMHFPSDVLIGGAIGALSGILVPHFHKHKLIKNPNISIIPFGNLDTRGFTFHYKLK